MAMFARFTTFFRWRKADDENTRSTVAGRSSIVPSPTTRKRSLDKVNQYLENGTLGDERRKSRLDSPLEMSASKRIKVSGDGSQRRQSDNTPETDPTGHSESPAQEKAKVADRRLMPPPAIPKSRQPRNNMGQTPSPRTPVLRADHDDTRSINSEQTNSSTRHRPDGKDQFEAERAARYADACALPPNSGIWSGAEHELFYHIAMRGYDPLLPKNWMRDFKTLPIALFAHQEDDIPLITPIHNTEFRAIRALRDLFETGKLMRDKVLSSPGFSIEHTLRCAIEKYMKWSISDAGISIDHSVLPVHRIAVRKKSQKTSDLIDELESELYELAQKHRDERGVLPSIEVPPASPVRKPLTPSVEDDPDGLPTLIGMIITYGILVVFTLNPNVKKIKAEPGTNSDEEDMGIRYIARFDFSDSGMDVWNGFAVAIVCMMVRKIQLEMGMPSTSISPKGKGKSKRRRGNGEQDPDL